MSEKCKKNDKMLSRFPFSMEKLPRHQHCGCFSLRFGCVLTALVVILYSLLAISQCLAVINAIPANGDDVVLHWVLFGIAIFVITVTFALSALMLLGVLRDKLCLIRPWLVWFSVQLAMATLFFFAGNAMRMAHTFDQSTLLLCAAEFLIILIKFYMLTVVASYARQLEERKEETERLKSADLETWYSDI